MSIKVVIVEPSYKPYVKEIENHLKSFQNVVGGLIKPVYPFEKDGVNLICYCNEESLYNGSNPNFQLYCDDIPILRIFGTVIVCGDDLNGGERSLTDEEIEFAIKFFSRRRFIQSDYDDEAFIYLNECDKLLKEKASFKLKEADEKEYLYAGVLPATIEGYTGYIGKLNVYYGLKGDSFLYDFDSGPYHKRAEELNFKREFNPFVDSLRQLFPSFNDIVSFCETVSPNNERKRYVFRKNTEKYAFVIELFPKKAECSLIVYCYLKDVFNAYLNSAEKGIRFITPRYTEVCRIPNGDKIVISDGDKNREFACYYIDDYHILIGCNVWHICEFAERMEKNNTPYKPVKDKAKDSKETFIE